jgi:hypothetical protein
MSKIDEQIETNQDELNDSLIKISQRIKVIKGDLTKGGISDDDEDKLNDELVSISKTIKNIKKTLVDLQKILDIFGEIEKSKNRPESQEYKDAKSKAENMKMTIMDEYITSLTELNKELDKLVVKNVNLSTWYQEEQNKDCGNNKCGNILKNISTDQDFINLVNAGKVPEIIELNKKFGKSKMGILQTGGSRKHKTHKLKQTNDLIYW